MKCENTTSKKVQTRKSELLTRNVSAITHGDLDGFTNRSKMEAFRLPRWMALAARERARAEDLTFSQFMRRAIRNELRKQYGTKV